MSDITVSNDLDPNPDGSFRIGPVMREARHLIRGSKRAFFFAGLFFVVVFVVPITLINVVFADSPRIAAVLTGLAALLIGSPFWCGMVAMTLHRAAGRAINTNMLFRYTRHWQPMLIAGAAGSILTWTFQLLLGQLWGSLLGFLCSFFLAYSSFFIVDQAQDALTAMRNSVRLVGRNFWSLLGLDVLAGLIYIVLSIVTLGIGLIWLIPWLYIAFGLAYAHAEGIHLEPLHE
ncbi:MAG TPA: hypothetical protein VF171_01455 [Trueperaceae bacterium]